MLRPDGTVFATGSDSDFGAGPGIRRSIIPPKENGRWELTSQTMTTQAIRIFVCCAATHGHVLVLGVSGYCLNTVLLPLICGWWPAF
jgi:hypothetical protein